MRTKLSQDLPLLTRANPEHGASDYVWSLTNGPSAIAQAISDVIEFYDAQDPFEPNKGVRP